MKESEIILQGSFLNIFGIGTLITGREGIGKSELALGLVARKHLFIADDAPFFWNQEGKLLGRNPLEHPFISIRGIGIIDVFLMFGAASFQKQGSLELIIALEEVALHSSAHLMGELSTKDILGCLIPYVTIPIIKPRNLEMLVEVVVKNHLLKKYKETPSVVNFKELLRKKMGTNHS